MGGYNVLIYGDGNCALGGRMESSIGDLEHIEKRRNVKIFGRVHVFGQSCLNMYGRFEELKKYIDLGGSSGQGGVYEYFYNGNQTIKTCEMQIQPISAEKFKAFLTMGKERLESDEVILILMGQGNMEGMFMDFALENPGVLKYEDILDCIKESLQPEVSHIHLIIDQAIWHYMKLPLLLGRCSFLESVFIYKRSQTDQFFPVGNFIRNIEHMGIDEALKQKEICGYDINLRQTEAFERLQLLWQAYQRKEIEIETLMQPYKKFVRKINTSDIGKEALKRMPGQGSSEGMQMLMDYFKWQYRIIVDEQNLREWLESLKICTDYHKL